MAEVDIFGLENRVDLMWLLLLMMIRGYRIVIDGWIFLILWELMWKVQISHWPCRSNLTEMDFNAIQVWFINKGKSSFLTPQLLGLSNFDPQLQNRVQ